MIPILVWIENVFELVLSGAGEVALVTVAFTALGSAMPISPDEVGVASRFGDPGDKWVGGHLYCAPKRRVNSQEHVCANRHAGYKRLPCGSILILESPRTKKRSWCKVMDRGPYGANVFSREPGEEKYTQAHKPNGRRQWYVKIRAGDKPPADQCPSQDCIGRWRGVLDLSPAVSNDLDHNGMERVKAWRLDRLIRHLKFKQKKRERMERRKQST